MTPEQLTTLRTLSPLTITTAARALNCSYNTARKRIYEAGLTPVQGRADRIREPTPCQGEPGCTTELQSGKGYKLYLSSKFHDGRGPVCTPCYQAGYNRARKARRKKSRVS